MMFLPRVGQEVIVDFLEGDPDQPIITGRVYNRDHMPPYKLPEKRTISAIRTCSSPGAQGGNEIRFEDATGQEQLLLFGQNSLHLRARGSRYESVGGDAHETVAGNAFELVSKNRHETVGLDLSRDVQGSKWEAIEGDSWQRVNGNAYHYSRGAHLIHNRGGLVLASDTEVTLWCKGNFITIDPTGVTIVGKLVKINSGGAVDHGEIPDRPEEARPKKPAPADTTEVGHNTRYSQAGVEPGNSESDSGSNNGNSDGVKQETSWIEIELIDEAGRPVPGEAFEVLLPDGKKIGGTLDGRGQAHVAVPDPGLCQVTFPKLDAAAWEKIG
jgi:type VI secretion system secreted protein VgrG